MTDSAPPEDGLERALDAALCRTLTPPRTPPQLRAKLHAAIVQTADSKEVRLRLEREQQETLAELEQEYVRLRRRTLGTMVGGAFAAGAVAALVLPWLTANIGPNAPLVLASAGAAIGIWIGVSSWLASRRDSGFQS